MLVLVGCADVPNLTEEQGNMIAEYAGGVLLRYSGKYELRLVEKDADEDGIEDMATPEPSADPDAEETVAPTPTPTPEAVTGSSAAPDITEEPASTEEPTVELNELYGIKGVEFSYDSTKFTKQYSGGDIYEITAEEGEILCVVGFDVKNTSNKTVKVDLTNRQFRYELDVGGDKVLPTISVLPNGGLNYLTAKIAAGKTEKAVLIFNLEESRKSEKDLTLTVTEGDKMAKIKL